MKPNQLFAIAIVATALFNLCFAQTIEFDNPIAEKRADPWVHKTEDGTYYFIATAPEYDRIVLRKATSINGLKGATEKVVWNKHRSGVMSAHIWAPELHKVDGKWYIYFAAGEAADVWKIRIFALSNPSEDPILGNWTEEGGIVTQQNTFSLDATSFEHNGKRYLIWAQTRGDGTALILSQMESPTKLTGPEVMITKPDLDWERKGHNVNEGAAVIKRNGKIFVAYSASATDFNYCMGLVWIDEEADLLKAANWKKSQNPVFYTNDTLKRFGPGHNSFTTSEDGKTDIMIYHARTYKAITGDPLNDPNRQTRARVLRWKTDGFPDFIQDRGDNDIPTQVISQKINLNKHNQIHLNPFTSTTTITIPDNGSDVFTFALYDCSGKLVKKLHTITTSHFEFHRESLADGFYYFRLYNSENVNFAGKLFNK